MSTLSRMPNATTVLRLLKCLPRMTKVLELRTTIWPAGALCSALALLSLAALAQHGHPLVGTWSGYWQTETDRHRVLLLLEYDGEAVTGVINPGRNSAPLTRASLDPSSWTVVLEATREGEDGNPVRTVIEGRIENVTSPTARSITGTWTEGEIEGELRVTLN